MALQLAPPFCEHELGCSTHVSEQLEVSPLRVAIAASVKWQYTLDVVEIGGQARAVRFPAFRGHDDVVIERVRVDLAEEVVIVRKAVQKDADADEVFCEARVVEADVIEELETVFFEALRIQEPPQIAVEIISDFIGDRGVDRQIIGEVTQRCDREVDRQKDDDDDGQHTRRKALEGDAQVCHARKKVALVFGSTGKYDHRRDHDEQDETADADADQRQQIKIRSGE